MSRRAGVPLGPLALLTAAVLGVHWLALRSAPELVAPTRASADLRLSVRSVDDTSKPQSRSRAEQRSPPANVPRSTRAPAHPRATAGNAAPSTEPAQPAPPAQLPIAAEPAAAAPLPLVPGSARWRYEATALWRSLAVAGHAELSWQHDAKHYEASFQIAVPSMPTRLQRSTGRIGPEGVLPLRFSERARSEEAAHFDRDGGRIVFSSNRAPVALEPGAQDRLSVLLQLSSLLAGDPSLFTPGRRIVVQTAGTREADRWVFEVDGVEQLTLPGGHTTATKLTRAPRHEYDQRLEVWFGPGPDYGVVRLRLTSPHGDWLDLQWSGTDKG